ncbi:hypothetical protein CRUP_037610 [Coryphaenoides rupestris]|nr:hypothetical protein CRUP_037610 [Coryphaenoides rupestris]
MSPWDRLWKKTKEERNGEFNEGHIIPRDSKTPLRATMFVPPLRKRQKRSVGAEGPRYAVVEEAAKFPDVRLYLVEKKMGASRRAFLTRLARAKGFLVEDILSDRVTHVVSEQNQAPGLWAWLRGRGLNDLSTLHVLDISWFTDSMREARPVTLEARHRIQSDGPRLPHAVGEPADVQHVQRGQVIQATPPQPRPQARSLVLFGHHDMGYGFLLFSGFDRSIISISLEPDLLGVDKLDAFEVLAESYEFSQSDAQCLAFRRAASVLKSLPCPLRCLGAAARLPCLGEHTRAVMELFTSVFGVGPKTAEKWYHGGRRTLQDALQDPGAELNTMQKAGKDSGGLTRVQQPCSHRGNMNSYQIAAWRP